MTRYRVLPYKAESNSARLLAEALGGKRIRLKESVYVSRPGDIVINWGNTDYPDFLYSTNLNCVPLYKVTNKLKFFKGMEDADWLPPFWTDPEEIPDDKFPIVCRTILTGHSGAGIVIADSRDDLVPCPLYVKYIPKKHEYRVHVGLNLNNEHFKADIIAVQQKKRRLDYDHPNWKIRNHANGFVYTREGVSPPVGVLDVAADCLVRSNLDFGAVDVIWNESQAKAYVLEINTAPGLEGQTVLDYANYFKGLI